MATSIETLFSDIASPEAIRAKEAEARKAQGEFLAQNPTANYGTMMMPERAARATQAIGGMLGVETRSEAEILAEANKKLFNQLMQEATAKFPKSQAAQLNYVADQLTAKGKPREAEKARNAAMAAMQKEADITKTQQEAFKNRQQGIEAQQKATTESLKRPYTLANELTQIEKLKAQAGEAEAGAALKRVQADESAQNKKLIQAKIKDVGMTDYLREVAATNLTKEDKEALNRQRVEIRAKTGGSQYDPNAISTQAVYDRGYEAVDKGMEAIQGYEVADMALKLLPDANTGAWVDLKDAGTWIGANLLGLDSEQNTKFANEFIDDLTKDVQLAKTTILKGVLSESDMKLIKDSIAGRESNPRTIQAAFSNLAATKYSDVKVAHMYDEFLLDPKKMLSIPHGKVKTAIATIAKYEYKASLITQNLVDPSLTPTKVELEAAMKARDVLSKYEIEYKAGIM